MKPGAQNGDHDKARGLLGLARIKVNAAADRAVQLYKGTAPSNGNIMSPRADRVSFCSVYIKHQHARMGFVWHTMLALTASAHLPWRWQAPVARRMTAALDTRCDPHPPLHRRGGPAS